MATKTDMPDWVEQAPKRLGGAGTIVTVAREVWQAHEPELRLSGDLFYTRQYDMRWGAYQLRQAGRMKPDEQSPSGVWELVE